MAIEIKGINIPEAYIEGLWKFRADSHLEVTRNGEAMVLNDIVILTIDRPWQRVLNCPIRDANPFFHVMEFCWMMAGERDARWLAQFNKNILTYADNEGLLLGAYGYRWANTWGFDQLEEVVRILTVDPNSRQAIVCMWDPVQDLHHVSSDRPCNMILKFSIDPRTGCLNMLVYNRSNDFIWGALGANAVHMTILQEVLAHELGVPVGHYSVVTDNMHIYTSLPNYEELLNTIVCPNEYGMIDHYPILLPGEQMADLRSDCHNLIYGGALSIEWMRTVAQPMRDAYLHKDKRTSFINQIAAVDWRTACQDWALRRAK